MATGWLRGSGHRATSRSHPCRWCCGDRPTVRRTSRREECSFADSRPLTEEIYRRETLTPDLVPRFVDQHASWERSIGARRFVARIDGALAGECELYIDGADAQVEFVDTLEEFRGRGVARAVVLGAAEAARTSGADRVFILADENDWPKDLYRRLGFDPMARRWEVHRWPGELRSARQEARRTRARSRRRRPAA